ncbi:MAG: DNA recombination protein RmuC [Deltaproteobacteria bacterium]|nr:DNA recombination protein RmuC [Deltaproteobacteria bacterium]
MTTVVVVACAVNLVLLLVLLLRRDTTSMVGELTRQNAAVRDDLAKGLAGVREKVQEDLQRGRKEQADAVSRSLGEVAERLTKLHEATGTVVELSKGINNLNTILSKSQGRGAFGEFALERMLEDLLGEHGDLFAIQYPFENGEKVDAAIFVRPDHAQILAVDSKFPLAHAIPILEGRGTPDDERAFAKDVRERAKEIATKYIRPPLTLDFAFMFVPSEAVYYLVLKDAKLHQELLQKKVIPTSPNAFYAYLQALAVAFRGMKIEQRAVEVQRAVVQVAKDFAKFLGDYSKVGEKLKQASTAYEDSQKDAERLTKRLDKLQIGEVKESAPALGEVPGS